MGSLSHNAIGCFSLPKLMHVPLSAYCLLCSSRCFRSLRQHLHLHHWPLRRGVHQVPGRLGRPFFEVHGSEYSSFVWDLWGLWDLWIGLRVPRRVIFGHPWNLEPQILNPRTPTPETQWKFEVCGQDWEELTSNDIADAFKQMQQQLMPQTQ